MILNIIKILGEISNTYTEGTNQERWIDEFVANLWRRIDELQEHFDRGHSDLETKATVDNSEKNTQNNRVRKREVSKRRDREKFFWKYSRIEIWNQK